MCGETGHFITFFLTRDGRRGIELLDARYRRGQDFLRGGVKPLALKAHRPVPGGFFLATAHKAFQHLASEYPARGIEPELQGAGRLDAMLESVVGRRLTYEELIA